MNAPQMAQKRLYYLDWLRILAVLVVFLLHVSMPYQTVPGVWLIQDQQTNLLFTLNAAFIHQWVMPLFFLVAGASVPFALMQRSQSEYMRERFLRLFIPLIVCSLAFSPIQRFFSLKSTGQFQGALSQFAPYWLSYCFHSSSAFLVRYGCYTEHLWFLGFLLTYSIISLPLLPRFQTPNGKRFTDWLASLVYLPAGLFLYILPITLIQAALKARFPEYQNWSDFCVWLVYFLYGYVLISKQNVPEVMERSRWGAFSIGLVCFSTMMFLLSMGDHAEVWELHPVFSPGFATYQALRSLNSWAWVVFFIGMAYRHLNFTNPLLRYASIAVLPFYILHHVAVVLIGYALLDWHFPLLFKFLALSIGVFMATLGLYEYVVKRSNLLRLMFGMRL